MILNDDQNRPETAPARPILYILVCFDVFHSPIPDTKA